MALPSALVHAVFRTLPIPELMRFRFNLSYWREQVYLRGVPRQRKLLTIQACQDAVSYVEAWEGGIAFLPLTTMIVLALRQARFPLAQHLLLRLLELDLKISGKPNASDGSFNYEYILAAADDQTLEMLPSNFQGVSVELFTAMLLHDEQLQKLTDARCTLLQSRFGRGPMDPSSRTVSWALQNFQAAKAQKPLMFPDHFAMEILAGARPALIDRNMSNYISCNVVPLGTTSIPNPEQWSEEISLSFSDNWLRVLANSIKTPLDFTILEDALPNLLPRELMVARAPELIKLTKHCYLPSAQREIWLTILTAFLEPSPITASQIKLCQEYSYLFLLAGVLDLEEISEATTKQLQTDLNNLNGVFLHHQIPKLPQIIQNCQHYEQVSFSLLDARVNEAFANMRKLGELEDVTTEFNEAVHVFHRLERLRSLLDAAAFSGRLADLL